jgi:hypothetical protein
MLCTLARWFPCSLYSPNEPMRAPYDPCRRQSCFVAIIIPRVARAWWCHRPAGDVTCKRSYGIVFKAFSNSNCQLNKECRYMAGPGYRKSKHWQWSQVNIKPVDNDDQKHCLICMTVTHLNTDYSIVKILWFALLLWKEHGVSPEQWYALCTETDIGEPNYYAGKSIWSVLKPGHPVIP